MYTREMETGEALHDCFRVALVLTGSVESAGHAVTDAIATIESDCSRDALLVETVRSTLPYQTFADEMFPALPPEVLAVHNGANRICQYNIIPATILNRVHRASSYRDTENAGRRKQEYLSGKPQVIMDALFKGKSAMWTAIFTGVLTFLTVKMYQVARITSETSRASERAFLSFSGPQLGARLGTLIDWNGYEVSVGWTNSGTTPAKNAVIRNNGDLWPTDLPDGFAFPLTADKTVAVVSPKGNYGVPMIVPKGMFVRSWHSQGKIFIWGSVAYRDIFLEIQSG